MQTETQTLGRVNETVIKDLVKKYNLLQNTKEAANRKSLAAENQQKGVKNDLRNALDNQQKIVVRIGKHVYVIEDTGVGVQLSKTLMLT